MDVWVLAGQGTATHGTGQVSTRQMQVLPTCQLPPTLHIYNTHANNIHTIYNVLYTPTIYIYIWHQQYLPAPTHLAYYTCDTSIHATKEYVTSVANVTSSTSQKCHKYSHHRTVDSGHSCQEQVNATPTLQTYTCDQLASDQLWLFVVSFLSICLF